jgi:pilus assembly protein CpaB
LVVALALVFGVSAALGINSLRNTGPGPDAGERVTVVVAAMDIPRGKAITSDLLKTRDYPKDLVPPGALEHVADALDRTVVVQLAKDEPLLESKLASRSAGRGLAPLIPDNMRACTINTNIASSVAGLIQPGNRVDVLLTVSPNNGPLDTTGGGSTTTLLQNVEILAVDQHVEAHFDGKADANQRSVTLLVTPDQAAKLVLGQNKGTLQLTLRNPGDRKPASATPATLSEIQFHQGKPWDQRIREMLQAASQMAAAQKEKPREEVKPVQEETPPLARIRTLRGTQEGAVYVETARGGKSR